jgi:acyl-CoA synthetase (AMP-forming)/AMP-acid ligase II
MEWLLERFMTRTASPAFTHEGRVVTYGEVLAKVDGFGEKLRELGVKAGEKVVILGDYSPEVVCLILALARNRNIIIPLSREGVIELSTALGVSGCHWFAEFDAEDIEVTITERRIPVENTLLADFLTTGAPGLVLFSSGSTGAPKGILHDFNRVAEKFLKPRQATTAIPFLMLDHFGGINTILAITSSLGHVVTVRNRSIASICRAIQDFKVELLPTTPSFLTMLMASNISQEYDLRSLKRITYGTEVMPQTTLTRLAKAFPGVELQQTYGLSEVGVLRSKSRPDGSLWVQIGGEGFKTKVVDEILWIKSEYAMVGYLNAPSEFDADGWFNTKDRVEVDGDYFRILGRITDLINVGGQKVYPTEIEEVILALDNVLDVVVYGERHPLLGQIVVAKVALAEPEEVASLKMRIRKACLANLAPFKAPTKVLISEQALYSVRQKKIRK